MFYYRAGLMVMRLVYLYPLQQTVQLSEAQCLLYPALRARDKPPMLKTRAPDRIAGAIEIQNLHLRTAAIDEHEIVPAQRLFRQPMLNQR